MYGLDGLFWCALNSSRFFKAVKMPHKWKIIKVNKENGLTWNCACSTQSNTNQSLNHYKSLEHESSAQNQMFNVQRQYTHKESHSTVYTITIAYNISESYKSQIQKKDDFLFGARSQCVFLANFSPSWAWTCYIFFCVGCCVSLSSFLPFFT